MLREHGLTSLASVRAAFMEGDGTISIIPYKNPGGAPSPRPNKRTIG